jgi:hypothetical protein
LTKNDECLHKRRVAGIEHLMRLAKARAHHYLANG